jgi:hypothetical protein
VPWEHGKGEGRRAQCTQRCNGQNWHASVLMDGQGQGPTDHEGALPCHDAVGGPQASEDPVSGGQAEAGGCHMAAGLRHQHRQACRPAAAAGARQPLVSGALSEAKGDAAMRRE